MTTDPFGNPKLPLYLHSLLSGTRVNEQINKEIKRHFRGNPLRAFFKNTSHIFRTRYIFIFNTKNKLKYASHVSKRGKGLLLHSP